MDIETLTRFFMWCTIINGVLFAVWALFIKLAPELVFKTQAAWVDLPRETVLTVLYAYLAMFKIVYLVFNVVPFVALLILE